MEFLSALAAIVVIDLVLAGDNAIVIALASRNVPRHRQRQAILWGTAGAIVTRSALTLVVVYLLKIPGLLFAGGAMLVWIAYKLLLPENGDGNAGKITAADSFWGAIRTIVVADMVMGLDNVLAVAGAAQGSFLLVVLGLLISIPIVVWGSTMLLTATPAATLLLQWDGQTLLRRGLLQDIPFRGGAICGRAQQQGKAISLVDLRLYPGRDEFEGLLPGLPERLPQRLSPPPLYPRPGAP